jgi:uncharacterized protein
MRGWNSIRLLLAGVLGLGLGAPLYAQNPIAADISGATACGQGPVSGAKTALLIGNGGYDGFNWPRLANSVSDVGEVCHALTSLGFAVRVVPNADFGQLQAALTEFSSASRGAQTVVVYYSGHGFSLDGRSYVVPLGAPPLTRRADINRRFVSIEAIVEQAVPAQAVTLLMIDACRTAEPIIRLADAPQVGDPVVTPLDGVIIRQGAVLYATELGAPAYDDAPPGSPISPFAAAVSRHLTRTGRGMPFNSFFDFVEDDVPETTRGMDRGSQFPYHYGRRLGALYLIDPPSEQVLLAGRMSSAAAPRSASGPPPPVAPQRPAATRGLASPSAPVLATIAPIPLTLRELALEDEPVLMRRVFRTHSPADIASLAASGDPLAQHLFGYMLHLGVGVRKDIVASRNWLERSASAGFAPAQLELGFWLLRNSRTYPDTVRAEQLMRAAVAQGLTKAKTHLAFYMASGRFGPSNHAAAEQLYIQAANEGHPAALFALTRFPSHYADVMARLRTLADNGNREGNYYLCEMSFSERRLATGIGDCTLAARANYAGAKALLARAYFDGSGVARDRTMAMHWAQLARADPELLDDALRIADIPDR